MSDVASPTPEQEQIIREEQIGVLATLRRDGSPQLTPVNYAYLDGRILISTTRDRAKYLNVRRNPLVSLCVVRAGGRPRYVVGFTVADGRIVAIDLIGDPAKVGRFDALDGDRR